MEVLETHLHWGQCQFRAVRCVDAHLMPSMIHNVDLFLLCAIEFRGQRVASNARLCCMGTVCVNVFLSRLFWLSSNE